VSGAGTYVRPTLSAAGVAYVNHRIYLQGTATREQCIGVTAAIALINTFVPSSSSEASAAAAAAAIATFSSR